MIRHIEGRVRDLTAAEATQRQKEPVSKESPFEIDSPPLTDLGYLSGELLSKMIGLANEVVESPGYFEKGRLSRSISLPNADPDFKDLAQFVTSVGERYLKRSLAGGATALLSVVTDSEEFKRYTEMDKAASNWHQDFEFGPSGFYLPPDSQARLIIPLLVGTMFATGRLVFDDITQIDSGAITRSEGLNAGRTVVGTGRILIKSEVDPSGGKIHVAEPGKVYTIPKRNVHKSPPLPTGRIFFQLDAS